MTQETQLGEEQLEEQTLVEHLRELRKRLVWSLVGVVVGAIGSWNFKEDIFDLIRKPIEPYLTTDQKGLVFTGLMENFTAYIKVALLSGLIVSCPFWLYQIWRFIAPALYKEEKRYGAAFIFVGSLLFISGVAFVYFLVYPIAFDFLLGFGNGKDQALITVNEYLGFFLKTTFLFGLAFEVPLILTVLGLVGIVSADFLAQNRRYAFLFVCFGSALLTPPDPMSMLMMACPMAVLYESSIWAIRIFSSKS